MEFTKLILFSKVNMFMNLILNNNQLNLKEKINSIIDTFEIKYQKDGTDLIKNIELGIYFGVSFIMILIQRNKINLFHDFLHKMLNNILISYNIFY